MIELRTLGSVELWTEGPSGSTRLELQPKRLAVLVYLAAARPWGGHARETLVALFWPELDAEHGRAALRKTLYHLREKLGRKVVVSEGPTVGISAGHLRCDARTFQEALEAGEREEALELYRGEFLSGFHVSDAPDFERWLDAQRSHLKQRALVAARTLSEEAGDAGRGDEAVRWGRRALAIDPLDEAALRRLLRALDAVANRTSAVRTYRRFRDRLRQRLQMDPSPESRELVASIRERHDSRTERTAASPPGPAGPRSRCDEPEDDEIEEEPSPSRGADSSRPEERLRPGAAEKSPAPTSASRGERGSDGRWRWITGGLVMLALVAAVLLFADRDRPDPDLDGSATDAGASAERSVAVLPFRNLAPGGESGYFAEGMRDAILTSLAALEDVVVLSPVAVRSVEVAEQPAGEIARELGADYALLGSVQQDGDRVQIRARLIEAGTGRLVWAERFDRSLTAEAVFDVQMQVARATATSLGANLPADESRRLLGRPTGAIDAYDYYLRGRHRLGYAVGENVADSEAVAQAIALFREALERDPDFALAHVGLAHGYRELAEQEGGGRWRDSVGAAAARALQLDPRLPDAHLARAEYFRLGTSSEHFASYVAEVRRTLELRPADPRAVLEAARVWWRAAHAGETLMLDQVYCWLDRAARVDPSDAEFLRALGFGAFAIGDFEAAGEAALAALKLEPDALRIYRLLVTSALARGDRSTALAHYESAHRIATSSPPDLASLGSMEVRLGLLDSARVHLEPVSEHILGRYTQEEMALALALWETGARERAREILTARERRERRALEKGNAGFWPAYNLAQILAIRGETEQAVRAMERAVELGWRLRAHVVPEIDGPLHDLWGEEGFDALMAEVAEEVDGLRREIENRGCGEIRELPDADLVRS